VVKCAERGGGLICRFYNPNLESAVAIPVMENARHVRLDEQTPVPERTKLMPNDIQTLYVDLT